MMAPKDAQVLIPKFVIMQVIWQGRIKIVDRGKIANQLTLKRLFWLIFAQSNRKDSLKEEAKEVWVRGKFEGA